MRKKTPPLNDASTSSSEEQQTDAAPTIDLFHKKALKYKCSSLFSLSLSLSWYVKYKKLMNFEVFPKPSVIFHHEKKNFAKSKFRVYPKKNRPNRSQNKKKNKQKKCSEKEGKERAERDSTCCRHHHHHHHHHRARLTRQKSL